MRQMNESMAETTTTFRERALLVPQYAGDEEMRKNRYYDMLRADIRKHVNYLACPTLEDMIARAREWVIDIEHIRKRKVKARKVTRFQGRNPRDLTLGRRSS